MKTVAAPPKTGPGKMLDFGLRERGPFIYAGPSFTNSPEPLRKGGCHYWRGDATEPWQSGAENQAGGLPDS